MTITRLLDVFTEDQICLVEQTTAQSLNALINLPSDMHTGYGLFWIGLLWIGSALFSYFAQGGQWRQRFTQQHGIANQTSLKQLDASQQSQYADAKSSLKSLFPVASDETLASLLIETSWIPISMTPKQNGRVCNPSQYTSGTGCLLAFGDGR